MTVSTKGYQILFGVIPGSTAEMFVMNLKVFHAAADLTWPTVSTQHLASQLLIGLGIEAQPRILRQYPGQDAFAVAWDKNSCFISSGRNL